MREIHFSPKEGGPSASVPPRRTSYPPLPPEMQKREMSRLRDLLSKGKMDEICSEGKAALPILGGILRDPEENEMAIIISAAETMLEISNGNMRGQDAVLCLMALGKESEIYPLGFPGIQALLDALKNKEMPLLRAQMVECIGRYCLLEIAEKCCPPGQEDFPRKHSAFVMLSIVRALEDVLLGKNEPAHVRAFAAFALAEATQVCKSTVSGRIIDNLRHVALTDENEQMRGFADDARELALSFQDDPDITVRLPWG